MTLRIPTSSTYTRFERGLAVSLQRVHSAQAQLSSGSRIGKLSDDAVGAAVALRLRAEEADWASYTRAAEDAQAVLGRTDGVLQSTSEVLRRAREAATAGISGGLDTAARNALGDKVAHLREELHGLANEQHLGRALFGGHRATAVSVGGTPPTYAYAGNSGTVNRQVSPSVTVAVNLDGREVFGFDAGPGSDVFAVLTRLENAVRSGDVPAMQQAQEQLAQRTDTVTAALGAVGAKVNRVTSATQVGTDALDRLAEQRSKIEDVDLAAAVMELQKAGNAYTAALGAVAKADLPSLANFLR